MSQSAATKLVSKLRFKIHPRRRLSNPEGPKGRHEKIKKTITALFKHERIEMPYHRADESRGYAELLLSEAIRNGDHHKPTMEMASYWIIEPPIVHKLFKVLAPRYKDYDKSYTKLWMAPNDYPGSPRHKCVLELRNNIYPPLHPDKTYNKNLIHNVLLEEARKAYLKKKEQMVAAKNEESKETFKDEVNQADVKQNLEAEATVNSSVNSEKLNMAEKESELSSQDLDSSSVNKSELKDEVNSKVDVDISKLEITEDKKETNDDKR